MVSDVSAADDDLALLDAWRAGDEDAGQVLFERHFDSLYRFFETKLETEADELVQATFFSCLSATVQFRGHSSFRTYLFAIAHNHLHRVLRQRYETKQVLDFRMSSIADLRSTATSRLARSERHRRMIDCLRQLPVEQQEILELHYWEDLDAVALSEVFRVSLVTIRTRLHRARTALRVIMNDQAKPLDAESTEARSGRDTGDSSEGLGVWVRRAARHISE